MLGFFWESLFQYPCWQCSSGGCHPQTIGSLRFLRTLAGRLYRQWITMAQAQFPGIRWRGHLPGMKKHHLGLRLTSYFLGRRESMHLSGPVSHSIPSCIATWSAGPCQMLCQNQGGGYPPVCPWKDVRLSTGSWQRAESHTSVSFESHDGCFSRYVLFKVCHGVAMDDVFQQLACYWRQGDRVVVRCFLLLSFLKNWHYPCISPVWWNLACVKWSPVD